MLVLNIDLISSKCHKPGASDSTWSRRSREAPPPMPRMPPTRLSAAPSASTLPRFLSSRAMLQGGAANRLLPRR